MHKETAPGLASERTADINRAILSEVRNLAFMPKLGTTPTKNGPTRMRRFAGFSRVLSGSLVPRQRQNCPHNPTIRPIRRRFRPRRKTKIRQESSIPSLIGRSPSPSTGGASVKYPLLGLLRHLLRQLLLDGLQVEARAFCIGGNSSAVSASLPTCCCT
jgi:hypothetical protein